MRIGFDIRCLMNKKYSGVSWYAFNLLNALLAIDQKNEYVLFYNSAKPVSLPKFAQPNARLVDFHWPNKLFNSLLIFFDWPKLDQLIGGCDIFFTPNLHFVSWSDRCKKIVVIHDLSFWVNPVWFTLKQRLWHKLILNTKIVQTADVIIADSYSTKNDLVDLLGIRPEKIRVVYLGMTNDQLPITNEIFNTKLHDEILDKYHITHPFFLFVGTIEPRKNVLGIIKAWQKLNQDVGLVLAGNWGWKIGKMTNDQFPITNSNAEKNKKIKFLGYVPEEDKAALYQSATALIYPSYYEGFGLPILEAMASGCPVICGNNSSQGEVLGDCGLMVNSDNINEISRAMELMLEDGDLRQDFIRRGMERAKEFTWLKTAQQVLEIFEQLK